MRVLVVGKAKTGTTALVSLVRQALEPCHLVMEPQSVLDFGPRSRAAAAAGSDGNEPGNEAIKILFEHFRDRPRHLDAIVHGEFGFPVDRVVFIVRDVRDEMVSKLLYHAKIVRNDGVIAEGADDRLAAWVRVLEEKEARPAALSFRELCRRFAELTGVDLWARLTDMASMTAFERYISERVERDHHALPYERMVRGDTADLAAYLGVPLATDMATVDLGQFGHTRRSADAGNWRSFFTPEDVELLRPLVRYAFGPFGNPAYDDWELTPVQRLDPAQYSGYVARTALA